MKKALTALFTLILLGAGCLDQINQENTQQAKNLSDNSTMTSGPTATHPTASVLRTEDDTLTADTFSLKLSGGALFYPNAGNDPNTARIQNYDTQLDYMSSGNYFMWISQRTALNSDEFKMDYKTVTTTNHLGKPVLRGEGLGTSSIGSEENVYRGYFFTNQNVVISIYAYDEAGLQTAESLLTAIRWLE